MQLLRTAAEEPRAWVAGLPRLGARWAAGAGVAGAAAFLLARLAPDVQSKPLFEDEAVSGLIAARPLWEILVTTLWDRGGAPAHFLLVHLAFAFDSSADALRWLSVAFALATVAVCYDLGHRLEGPVAGVTAAIVAAASGMLAVYGSFGRMYALFAFAAALAADLFVRAVDLRTTRAVTAAAAAAWLLPAVHTYGGIVVAAEAVVALVLWRGRRPLRAAVPVVAIGLMLVPFAIADLRLADRFDVGESSPSRLATTGEAWSQLVDAVRGFAGGSGWTLVLFVALGLLGAARLLRRRPEFVLWGAVALVLPPVLSTLVHTSRAPDLSPRHLIFGLPFWASFVGAAVARAPARTPAVAALVAVAALAAVSPYGIRDPRSVTYTAALGTGDALAAPSAWLRATVEPGDALYPYSSVYLAGLPQTGEAQALPRGQPQSVLAAARRLDYPVAHAFVAVPVGKTPVAETDGGRSFGPWLLVRIEGPFPDDVAVLQAVEQALVEARRALRSPVTETLAAWFRLNLDVLCQSLRSLNAECVSE